jgi:dipeptidyl aminopeptidase/acylaminoacyl peptidase
VSPMRRCSTRLSLLLYLTALSVMASPSSSFAQEKLAFRIDDEVTRFKFSADGRIAYSVRHVFSQNKIQLQRDDLWVAERDAKKKRILQGEKFVLGTGPFSYLVRGLRWSPDGKKLAVELATSEMINEAGDTREGVATLLIDDNGMEIPVAGGGGLISGAVNAAWLRDGSTVAYLYTPPPIPAPRPDQPPSKESFYLLARAKPPLARVDLAVSGYKLWAIDWDAAKDSAAAIEPGETPNDAARIPVSIDWFRRPHLKLFDLDKETIGELGSLDGYAGGFSLSPSGEKVAYWVSNEQLEVREIGSPSHVARVRVVLGTLAWAGDEKRVLVKQGPVGKSGTLVWVTLPSLAHVDSTATPPTQDVVPTSILHDLEFRQFEISPDGRFLGVVEPGKRNLLVYALP